MINHKREARLKWLRTNKEEDYKKQERKNKNKR